MNKGLFGILSLSLILGAGIISSCDQLEKLEENKENKDNTINNPAKPDNPQQPENPQDTTVYSAVDQKEFLEDASIEMLNMFPSTEFDDLADFGMEIDRLYDDYEWNNVEQWGDDAFEACKKMLGQSSRKTYERKSTSSSYPWRESYYEYLTEYKLVLAFSNFTGRFTAADGCWSFTPHNALEFDFKDEAGNDCVIQLSTSGTKTKLLSPSYSEGVRYVENVKYYQDSTLYLAYEYIDKYNIELEMPQEAKFIVKRGNDILMELVLKTDIRSLAGNGAVDISRSIIGVSSEFKLNNGYRITVDNITFQGNTSLYASAKMFLNTDELLSVSASAKIAGFPSLTLTDDDMDALEEYFEERFENDNSNITDLSVLVDIHKKVQLGGWITNVRKLYDYMDKAESYIDNETKFKDYVNKVNESMNVGMYFNGNSTLQAAVKMEPFAKRYWSYEYNQYRERWSIRPVIILSDGSQASTFEDYFDERDFKKLINTFQALMDNYEEMVDPEPEEE